ncbi:hypothetical protein J4212_05205 [Candidatus Woesearchaeota archaeon]|nr:hypothetical protein [Candidatus Woesearchaeota archaeon]
MARGGQEYYEPLHERTLFQYIVVLLIIGAFAFSLLAYLNTNKLKSELVPRTINAQDFLNKLTAHDEMKAYVGAAPLNIIEISQNNIGNLQTQIAGLDVSFIGSYLIQYQNAVVVYDYDNDVIKGQVQLQQPQQAQLPADFTQKLYAHPEAQGLEGQQPVGGQIDAQSLQTLQQQFPQVYANAKVGDFLLRYESRLIVYDYNADRIVNAVNLG